LRRAAREGRSTRSELLALSLYPSLLFSPSLYLERRTNLLLTRSALLLFPCLLARSPPLPLYTDVDEEGGHCHVDDDAPFECVDMR